MLLLYVHFTFTVYKVAIFDITQKDCVWNGLLAVTNRLGNIAAGSDEGAKLAQSPWQLELTMLKALAGKMSCCLMPWVGTLWNLRTSRRSTKFIHQGFIQIWKCTYSFMFDWKSWCISRCSTYGTVLIQKDSCPYHCWLWNRYIHQTRESIALGLLSIVAYNLLNMP